MKILTNAALLQYPILQSPMPKAADWNNDTLPAM